MILWGKWGYRLVETALQLLSGYPHPEQVRKIRDQETGVDYVDPNNSSLLHYKCRNGWCDASKVLVHKCRCDPHLQNRWQFTPLHYACRRGSIDIVRFLIVDHHCDPACCGWLGRTPLHCARVANVKNQPPNFEQLIPCA